MRSSGRTTCSTAPRPASRCRADSTTAVVGQAMLSMQLPEKKRAIIA